MKVKIKMKKESFFIETHSIKFLENITNKMKKKISNIFKKSKKNGRRFQTLN